MRQLLKNNRYFLIPYVLVVFICGILLIIYSKPELHILTNQANSKFFDTFFKYFTNLGDGAMIAILFILLLFVKYRYAFAFLTGGLVTSALVQILKKVVLGDIYRPSKYFELYETYQLHFVEGVKLHALQSFPSGHAATSFNLFLALAIVIGNNNLKIVFFVFAALTAYSRVYLSQHFLIDIAAGSVIGVIIILLFFQWFNTMNKAWLNKSLLKR